MIALKAMNSYRIIVRQSPYIIDSEIENGRGNNLIKPTKIQNVCSTFEFFIVNKR
jgi:hypothetical protein